jgi:hypothetical protein
MIDLNVAERSLLLSDQAREPLQELIVVVVPALAADTAQVAGKSVGQVAGSGIDTKDVGFGYSSTEDSLKVRWTSEGFDNMDEVVEVASAVEVVIVKSNDDTGEECRIVTESNLRCHSSSHY